MVGVQEMFVIAHELTHIAIKEKEANPAFVEFSSLAEGAFSTVEELSRGHSSNTDDVPEILGMRDNPRVREEMVCDLVATIAVASFWKSQEPAFAGSAMAMKNLVLLQILDNRSEKNDERTKWRKSQEIEAEMRYLALHAAIHRQFQATIDYIDPITGSRFRPSNSAFNESIKAMVHMEDIHALHEEKLRRPLNYFSRVLLKRIQEPMDEATELSIINLAGNDRRWLAEWLRMPVGVTLSGGDPLLYSRDEADAILKRTELLWADIHHLFRASG